MWTRMRMGWHYFPSYSHTEAGLMEKLGTWPLSRCASSREPHAVPRSWCHRVTSCIKYLICRDTGILSPAEKKCRGWCSSPIYINIFICINSFLKLSMDNCGGTGWGKMGAGEEEGRKGEKKVKKERKKFKRKHFLLWLTWSPIKNRWTNTKDPNLVSTNLVSDDHSILSHLSILRMYGF